MSATGGSARQRGAIRTRRRATTSDPHRPQDSAPNRAAGPIVVFGSIAAVLAAVALLSAFAAPLPLIAWLGFGVVSVVAFALGVLGILAFPRMRANAPTPAAADDGGRRLLVVADARCIEAALCEEIEARRGGAVAVHLVVPVRVSHLHYLTADEAEERRDAEESLLISVGLLHRRGIPATGSVGGDDPLEAMTDALAWFPATDVLLAIPPAAEVYWLEDHLLERERALTTAAVTEVVVASDRSSGESRQPLSATSIRNRKPEGEEQ